MPRDNTHAYQHSRFHDLTNRQKSHTWNLKDSKAKNKVVKTMLVKQSLIRIVRLPFTTFHHCLALVQSKGICSLVTYSSDGEKYRIFQSEKRCHSSESQLDSWNGGAMITSRPFREKSIWSVKTGRNTQLPLAKTGTFPPLWNSKTTILRWQMLPKWPQ